MFQYFFGESLNLKYVSHNVRYLDSLLPPDQIKIWDIFDVDINLINRKKLPRFNWLIKRNKSIFTNYIKLLIKFDLNQNSNIYSDNNYNSKIKLSKNNKDMYFFYGYWQNINYFNKNFKEILKKFKFKKKLNIASLDNDIKDYDSIIGVHIRGGDYLKTKNKKIFHYVDQDYYLTNIDLLNKKFKNALFIIFTDDKSYAYNLLPKLAVKYKYIHDLTNNRIDDFQYLSLCNHFIIPNSSFSLWAAYYSKYKYKTIIMPDEWFNKNYKDKFKIKNTLKPL